MATKTKSIAVKAPQDTEIAAFEMTALTGDLAEMYAEELDGLGSLRPEVIKIPSGGGLAFEVPSEDPEDPDIVKTIDAVIIHHHATNSYWPSSYTGGNEQPDCASYDGKIGLDKYGELHDCATCSRNEFIGETGKACKNMHRLYILREGTPMPMQLSLPPTALKSLRDYLGKNILRKGKRSYEYVTRIGLKKETSKGGIEYSTPTFTYMGLLSKEDALAAKSMCELLKKQQSGMVDLQQETAMIPPPVEQMVSTDDIPEEFGEFMEVPDPAPAPEQLTIEEA
ncbi:MAG: hypothetical protein Q4C04_04345 [Clostridia bacterium]|nr:hypothetical protein [Clostridia bacterium]